MGYSWRPGDRLLNRYDVPDLRGFEDRVRCAADRLVQRYPTIARACFPRDQFDVIGTYVLEADCQHRTLDITDQDSLDHWLGDVHSDIGGTNHHNTHSN